MSRAITQAEKLNTLWKVGAVESRYFHDGTVYEPLTRFPGAYFDDKGYVLFATQKDFEQSPYLEIAYGKVRIHGGISTHKGYVQRAKWSVSTRPATRAPEPKPERIRPGSVIHLEDGSVYVFGTDITEDSPAGRALIGRTAGFSAEIMTRRGPKQFKIARVVND